MDQEIEEIFSYVQKLPPHMKDVVLAMEWLPRVEEIGQKYSLDESKTTSIIYEVLFILCGMEDEENLTENIKSELDISQILAEQIHEDIEERVIGFLLKKVEQIEVKNKPIEGSAQQIVHISEQKKEPLDIPPMNLPGEVVEEEIVKTNESPMPEKSTPREASFELPSAFIPLKETPPAGIQVSAQDTSTPPSTPNASTFSFINQKLSQVTTPKPVVPEINPSSKEDPTLSVSLGVPRGADPYREPIE